MIAGATKEAKKIEESITPEPTNKRRQPTCVATIPEQVEYKFTPDESPKTPVCCTVKKRKIGGVMLTNSLFFPSGCDAILSPLRQQHSANAACSQYPPPKQQPLAVGLSVDESASKLVDESIDESIGVSIFESIGEQLSESVSVGDGVGGSISNCQTKKQNKVCNINFCSILFVIKVMYC